MSEAVSELRSELGDASNVLVLEDGSASAQQRVHEALLGCANEPRDVLAVTFSQPEPWLDAWSDYLQTDGANLGLIQLTENDLPKGRRGGAYVRPMDPNDLTGLGMAIRDFFDGVESNPRPAAACFDSVTSLAAYHDVPTLFRFLRMVTHQVQAEDATAHFHVDPVAHDAEALAKLKPPFDAHVEVDSGGSVSVTTPY